MTSTSPPETELAAAWFIAAQAMFVASGNEPRSDDASAGLYAQAILGLPQDACLEAKRSGRLASMTLVDCLGAVRRMPHDVAEKVVAGVMMIAYSDRSLHPLEVRWASMLASAAELGPEEFQRCCASARVMAAMLRPRRGGGGGVSGGEGDGGNFGFLDDYDRTVGRLARQAETYVHTDPESCLFKLRLMVETMAKRLIEMQRPHLVSSDLGTMLQALERDGVLPRANADNMHAIRRDGNAAVHGRPMPAPTAMRRLRDAHRLSDWFCRMVKRGAKLARRDFTPPPQPVPPDRRAREALERAEALESEIEERRLETREALLLFGGEFDVERDAKRLIDELEALNRVASAAGEPLVDADSVALVMAMELERLLAHPRLGLSSRDAQVEAERQLDSVKHQLDEREHAYEADRARLAAQAMGVDEEEEATE